MITLRHHLVSLIAVFLALGLGVVAGSTFISPVTVSALKGSINRLDQRERTVEGENSKLRQDNATLSQFATASRDLMVHNLMPGRPAMIVSFDSTPSDETSQVATTLSEAGMHLQGSVVLSSDLALADDASRQRVAGALGMAAAPADTLQGELLRELSGALSGASPGVFQRLVAAGVAKLNSVPSQVPTAQLASLGSAVVILAPLAAQSGAKPPPDLSRSLILPLVHALSGSALVAVGEDGSSPIPVLTPIRQDSALKVVTVDGVDTAMGQAGIVLGLAAASSGLWGNYGTGPGAGNLLPGTLPVQTPSATVSASPR